jgi:hypothetical protein
VVAPRVALRRQRGMVHPWYTSPRRRRTPSALGSGTSRYAVYIVCDERGGAEKMKVEILYFDGCPTYLRAEETLRGVLAREGVEADEILVPAQQD